MTLFDELLKTKHYQELLDKLPKDEREALVKSLREFVDSFENNIIIPLKNLDSK